MKKHGILLLHASITRLTILYPKNQLKCIGNTIITLPSLNATKIQPMQPVENLNLSVFCLTAGLPAIRPTSYVL